MANKKDDYTPPLIDLEEEEEVKILGEHPPSSKILKQTCTIQTREGRVYRTTRALVETMENDGSVTYKLIVKTTTEGHQSVVNEYPII